jgi:hypothetical protein
MPSSKVAPSDIYCLAKDEQSQAKISQVRVKFKVGDHVRITKEKVKFA